MADLWLTFGRGGVLPVRLFEAESPHNAGELRRALPVRSMARHCSWSGEGFVWRASGLDIRPERQRSAGIGPGALCIEHYPMGVREVGPWTALLLVYGEQFWFRNPFTPACSLCVVGQVTGDLPELAAVGERIHRQGLESVVLTTEREK